jgi:uncharacterized protein YxjI
MRLYAKEKVFTLTDKFRFFDENENDVYLVEGKFWSFTKQLTMTDALSNEVALIKEQFFTWMPKFHVFVGGVEVAEIRKQFTFFKPKYSIDCKGWEIQGDFLNHDYSIMKGDYQIATIHKRWLTWGDTYEINITDPADAVLVCSIVLCIDCVDERNAAASSSASSSSSSS